MQVREVMSSHLQSVPPDASLSYAAQQMRDLDIGMLPVETDGEIVGTLTDRDITIRAIASGADPNAMQVGDIMSHEIFTCSEEDDLLQAARIMEDHQVRRLIVEDQSGKYVGMLALADIARHQEMGDLGAEILSGVSQAH